MSDRRVIKQIEEVRTASTALGLDSLRCLVLNQDFRPLSSFPISAVGWQDAIVGELQNKYKVLAYYEDRSIRTPSTEFFIPSVVVTSKFSNPKRRVLFSKTNIYLRDDYQCQYCDKHFTGSELTFDHLVPRSRGGKTSWTNIVSSCDRCNAAKGNKSLVEWMASNGKKLPSGRSSLRKQPYHPTFFELAEKARYMPLIIPEGSKWENYLQWHGPLFIRNGNGGTYQISGPDGGQVGKEELGY